MAWRKLGRVFTPAGRHPALASHAALPVAAPLSGDLVRVLFSGRDARNRSSVGSVVLRVGERPRVEDAPPAPLLEPGPLGAFDDSGLGVGSVVRGESEDRLYYMGWNIGGSVPWRNAIGVAVGSIADGRFERLSIGPIMDRDTVDHYSLSYPWVVNTGPGAWVMWYGTHLAWGARKADMSHSIRRATSADGISWSRDPAVVLAPEGDDIAVVRPTVLAARDGLRMWFARRAHGRYGLGHAVSVDGVSWRRRDAEFPAPEADGWEGGAATYPSVFAHADRLWLLYNGDGYGATGFGLAVWEE
jgi:hypothetical protein